MKDFLLSKIAFGSPRQSVVSTEQMMCLNQELSLGRGNAYLENRSGEVAKRGDLPLRAGFWSMTLPTSLTEVPEAEK